MGGGGCGGITCDTQLWVAQDQCDPGGHFGVCTLYTQDCNP
jgi:hypothetical protein